MVWTDGGTPQVDAFSVWGCPLYVKVWKYPDTTVRWEEYTGKGRIL